MSLTSTTSNILRNRIYVAALEAFTGNFDHNIAQIVASIHQAINDGKDIVVTPELSLCGYPPEDLIKRVINGQTWVQLAMQAGEKLLDEISNVDGEFRLFFGNVYASNSDVLHDFENVAHSTVHRSTVYNCYFEALKDETGARIVRRVVKRDLPNYSVFDERRYFTPPNDYCVEIGDIVELKNAQEIITDEADVSISVAICEDIWNDVPLPIIPQSELILVPNASPFEVGKNPRRIAACQKLAHKYSKNVLYYNATGAQDELVFDNAQIYVSADAKVLESPTQVSELQEMYLAIVQSLRSYCQKNGLKNTVLGLSGGIDSALVATIAVDALGSEHVHGILMPSQYSSSHSVADAVDLAKRLGIETNTIPIQPIYAAYTSTFADILEMGSTAQENLQARIRGNILMAHSNSAKQLCLVLATGNKSELAVGYSTIYGDAVGGFAPIKDVLKTKVWELAKWRNSLTTLQTEQLNLCKRLHIIPQNSISKPPSAELSPGQYDQQTLPEYEVLDAVIMHIMQGSDLDDSVDDAIVKKVREMMKNAAWKRLQFPPGPKLTHMSFGKDWRMPISATWWG